MDSKLGAGGKESIDVGAYEELLNYSWLRRRGLIEIRIGMTTEGSGESVTVFGNPN